MLLTDHPFVGQIWLPTQARWITEAELLAELATADYVLLGEKHDNPDHHRLQARCIRALAAEGHRLSVAFEMLEIDQQTTVDAALTEGLDADAFAAAVDWETNWTGWELYREVVTATLEATAPIVAANFPREMARRAVREGLDGLDPRVVSLLGLDEPLEADVHHQLVLELHEAHCGHLPPAMADAMVLAQRARDAQMAERVVAARTDEVQMVLLVTGTGHARTDRAVPALIQQRDPEATTRSIAFVEVSEELTEPTPAAHDFPFDAVWFTPRVTDEDPCGAFRR